MEATNVGATNVEPTDVILMHKVGVRLDILTDLFGALCIEEPASNAATEVN